jgi:hypothetical protein
MAPPRAPLLLIQLPLRALSLIASGVAVVTHVSKLFLETIASQLDEDFYLRLERSFSGNSASRCRITAGAKLCNRRIANPCRVRIFAAGDV